MAGPPPQPLPSFPNTLFSKRYDVGQTFEHFFQYFYEVAASDEIQWRRFVLKAKDLNTGETADESRCTFDIVNFTGGAIDVTWTSGDYTAAGGHLWNIATMWTAHMSSSHAWTGIDGYVMKWNPNWAGSDPLDKDIHPFQDTGPPDYVFKANLVGAVPTAIAPQIAFSVTEEQALRRNWGRFYLPFPTAAVHSGTTGRFTTSLVDEVAQKVHDEYAAMAASELYPVIAVSQTKKNRVSSLASVDAIRCDDVPDVIRRRRFSHAVYRKILPVPA